MKSTVYIDKKYNCLDMYESREHIAVGYFQSGASKDNIYREGIQH
jgi:hypothetical protein